MVNRHNIDFVVSEEKSVATSALFVDLKKLHSYNLTDKNKMYHIKAKKYNYNKFDFFFKNNNMISSS